MSIPRPSQLVIDGVDCVIVHCVTVELNFLFICLCHLSSVLCFCLMYGE